MCVYSFFSISFFPQKTALVFCLLLALTICQQINLTKAQSSEALLRGLVDDLLKALEFGGRAFGRDFVDILGDIIDNNAFGRLDPYIRQIVEQARDRAVEAGDNFWRRCECIYPKGA